MSGYEHKNRNFNQLNLNQLRRCLKTASDSAAVTWAGRSFHTAAPEAVNVRLPTVDMSRLGYLGPMLAVKMTGGGMQCGGNGVLMHTTCEPSCWQ